MLSLPLLNWVLTATRFPCVALATRTLAAEGIDLQPDARLRDQPTLSWQIQDDLDDLEMEVSMIRHWFEHGPQDQNETPLDEDEEDAKPATLQGSQPTIDVSDLPVVELQSKHGIVDDIIGHLELSVARIPKAT